uniref:QcrA and Rieske domain-containing protein n=1 Tax=uncultured Draconibacterium sp. TaxID=1573823 RepID=UPI00321743E4
MALNTRRNFVKIILAGIAAIFVFLWNKLISNHIATTQHSKNKLPFNKNKTVSFYDQYIVVTQNNKTTVLSARCTHLGCTINSATNGKLVCPCHGSEYDFNGKVLKGPAYKNLEVVSSKITNNGQNIEIGG